MAVVSALRETPGALLRNPVLFAPVAVLMLLQVPSLALRAVNPFLASIVSSVISLAFIFVTPFFLAGMIAMADEALDNRTTLSTFTREGKSNYVSVLVAALIVFAVNLILGFILVAAALFGGIAFFAGGSHQISPVLLVVLGGIALILVLGYLTFIFFIQFYAQAIVLNDLGAVDGIKHSYRVIRRNLVSAFGYSALVGILGGIAGIVFGGVSIFVTPDAMTVLPLPGVSPFGVFAAILILVVAGTGFGGFLGVYAVAFYRRINGSVTH